MQIAEKNREIISGISGNMHDGYDIIFKDGHSCHCCTKKDVRRCIIKYCCKNSDQFILFYCKMCLAQDFKSIAQDNISFVSYRKNFVCFMLSDKIPESKENPENTMSSGLLFLFEIRLNYRLHSSERLKYSVFKAFVCYLSLTHIIL